MICRTKKIARGAAAGLVFADAAETLVLVGEVLAADLQRPDVADVGRQRGVGARELLGVAKRAQVTGRHAQGRAPDHVVLALVDLGLDALLPVVLGNARGLQAVALVGALEVEQFALDQAKDFLAARLSPSQ